MAITSSHAITSKASWVCSTQGRGQPHACGRATISSVPQLRGPVTYTCGGLFVSDKRDRDTHDGASLLVGHRRLQLTLQHVQDLGYCYLHMSDDRLAGFDFFQEIDFGPLEPDTEG